MVPSLAQSSAASPLLLVLLVGIDALNEPVRDALVLAPFLILMTLVRLLEKSLERGQVVARHRLT
jgi:hypothetical protein